MWELSKIYLIVNGCEVGQLSTTIIQNFFIANSNSITENPADADVLIFYACGLTKENEDDSKRIIKRLKSVMKPSGTLIVWGCLPVINPNSLKSLYEGPMLGPKDYSFFEEMIERKTIPFEKVQTNPLVKRQTYIQPTSLLSKLESVAGLQNKLNNLTNILAPTHARPYYIRVASGCTGNCTYCSEKLAWGRIKSIAMKRILGGFKRGLHLGYRNFFLVAEDLGAYGVDIGCTLPELLERMTGEYQELNYKLILNEINPIYVKQFYTRLEKVFESGKIGMLGCQVESGSNRMLKLMGRHYTVEDWLKLMTDIHHKYPRINLSTHLMVGFPTESDYDFQATCSLLDRIPLDHIIIFKYSDRPRIPARNFSQKVSEEMKEKRYQQLLHKARSNIRRTKIKRFFSLLIGQQTI